MIFLTGNYIKLWIHLVTLRKNPWHMDYMDCLVSQRGRWCNGDSCPIKSIRAQIWQKICADLHLNCMFVARQIRVRWLQEPCYEIPPIWPPNNEPVYGELAASQDGTSKLQRQYNIHIYSCMYTVVYTHIDRFQFYIIYIIGVYDISVYIYLYIHII